MFLSCLSKQTPPIENSLIFAPFCSNNPNLKVSNFINCYNPSNNTWDRVTSIPVQGESLALKDFAMVSINHYIFIIGGRHCRKVPSGYDSTDTNFAKEDKPKVLSSVLRYNVKTDTWDTCAPMSTPRFNFACIVSDNKIYVAGGQSILGCAKGIASTEVYDPTLDKWNSLADMSMMRYKCVGVLWRDKIHVVGGFVNGDGPYMMKRSSAEVYDSEKDMWDFKARMWELDVPPNQIVSVNGNLFSSGDCFVPWKGHIEAYDETLNIWNMVGGSHFECLSPKSDSPPMERAYLSMAPIEDKLYFLAGYRIGGEKTRMRKEVHVFDTGFNGDGWRSFEAFEEEGEQELCGHCCVLKHDMTHSLGCIEIPKDVELRIWQQVKENK